MTYFQDPTRRSTRTRTRRQNPKGRLAATISAISLLSAGPLPLLGPTAVPWLLQVQPAQAQSAESVARIAQAITVRIEGATQGSGVLVKREGSRYTVLTAWHVVSDNRPGEEVAIFTADGKQHQMEQGSVQRLGDLDLAVLTFFSSSSYELARIGDDKRVLIGSPIYVAGFPRSSDAVPIRIFRFLEGRVIANSSVPLPNGYQLIYSNQTLPGMSGGSALNIDGELVGIHGRAETDSILTEQKDVAVKTGSNQAVSISLALAFYALIMGRKPDDSNQTSPANSSKNSVPVAQPSSGTTVDTASPQAITTDDYLKQAKVLWERQNQSWVRLEGSKLAQEVVRLSNKVLTIRQSAEAYLYRASAKLILEEHQGALSDLNQVIKLDQYNLRAYLDRASIKKFFLSDYQGSITDLSRVIEIDPSNPIAYFERASIKDLFLDNKLGASTDYKQAIAAYTQIIRLDPNNPEAYFGRASAQERLDNKLEASTDYKQAIAAYTQIIKLDPNNPETYFKRAEVKRSMDDYQGAVADYTRIIEIDPKNLDAYFWRALSKKSLKDYRGAIADYTRIIELNPKDKYAYSARADVKKIGLDDYRGAIADYTKIIELYPDNKYAYSDRAYARLAINDRLEACKDFKLAVKLDITFAEDLRVNCGSR